MRNKLSQTQRMALLWAGALAPAAEHLPRRLADLVGTGSWLAPLLAALLVLLALSLSGALAGERGLAASLPSLLGEKAGKGVLVLYLLWALFLLALRFRLCAQRLADSGTRDGNLWFFLLITAALTLWMGRGPLGAFARAGQLFLGILLAAMVVVLLLSLRPADPLRLTPVALSTKPLFTGVLTTAGTLGWGLFAAFLPTKKGEEKGSAHAILWTLGGCGLLAMGQAVLLSCLGVGLVARLDRPFFTLTKQIGIEGAFQRVESAAAALWTLADLCMAGILVFAIQYIVEAWKSRPAPWCPWLTVLGSGTTALAFPAGGAAGAALAARWVPLGNLFLGLVLPAVFWWIQRMKDRRTEKFEKNEKRC